MGIRDRSGGSIDVAAGEVRVICGPSGCGKSTLLRCINGLETIQGGNISVSGVDVDHRNPDALKRVRQMAGMVFQNPDNQMVATIVEEDVAFGCENLGVPPAEIRLRVDSALKEVNMYEYRKHAPHLLSGGQKQRIAIARALIMNPNILIFDEATSSLDYESEKIIQQNLNLIRQGRTVIFIAHRLSIMRDCDMIIVIDRGKIVETGNHEALMQKDGLYAYLYKQQEENRLR